MVALTSSHSQHRFRLGKLVATPGAIAALQKSGDDVAIFLNRHRICDWSELPPDDARANEQAIAHEGDMNQQGRVLSSYRTSAGEVLWLITEADRSSTCLLTPDEY
ncbi:MAG: hypothetical protein WCI73_01705 [Phycisphaerae bacterium]